jgi:archaellum component FlaG (FlaF/FlaG flagellin family)
MFNVVTDQLKVSEGWVRCGQCADVFDAKIHLQAENTPLPFQVPSISNDELSPSAMASTGSGYVSYAEEVTAALNTPNESAAPAAMDEPSPAPTAASEETEPVFVDKLDALSGEIPSDVSFVRDARRQAFWRKPLIRLLLGLSALLLLGLLALQAAVMHRDSLAAYEPRLKPALQMFCERLACQVGPVRQIEAIVIDSSSFKKINDAGIYRLTFIVKNTGSMAVSMPSLEVTLTDTQDQPVLRRVLTPAQLSASSSMLAAGAGFAGDLSLQVAVNPSPLNDATATGLSLRVAGYRLLAFYP